MSIGLGVVLALAWLVVAVATLIWGNALFVRLLGEEDCLPPGSFGPPLFISGALAILLGWLLSRWGIASLFLIYAIPGLVAALWALRLRLAERQARKKEFGWSHGRLVHLDDGAVLTPKYAKKGAAYFTTGPAGGYCLYSIELHGAGGAIARNGYVREEAARRDLDRLLRHGCETIDAVIVWQATPTVFYSVHLAAWAELLCANRHAMPGDSAHFWRRWIRPYFPVDGSAELATAELRAHSEPLIAAKPDNGERLEALLDMAGPSMLIMTERAQRKLYDVTRGRKGRSVLELENGIAKTTLLPG